MECIGGCGSIIKCSIAGYCGNCYLSICKFEQEKKEAGIYE